MADPNDVQATKQARRVFTKHHVDLTLADLRVAHGVVTLRGVVQKERGAAYDDTRIEVERIGRILRQLPGVRDVVIDCIFRG